jgi:DNA repair photolyase
MSHGDAPRGRGAAENPPNRFERLAIDVDDESEPPPDGTPLVPTQFFRDVTRTIIARNDSPDIPFAASFNPYRGCEHGCIYCYARPTHEYLGLSAGLDFETRIFVKEEAPRLLRETLSRPSWKPEALALSGVTDPYQPVERRLELTRRCLQVLAEFRNPVGVITKSALVLRDADVLADLAAHSAADVAVSITTLDEHVRRAMEPRTATIDQRFEAIARLNAAGVPAGVMVAPVVPGLTDHELPRILERAAEAGARFAGYVMLRLPYAVAPLFESWLGRSFPDRKDKILERIRDVRGGRLNDPRFGSRQRGAGPYADLVGRMFRMARERAGIPARGPALSTAAFRRATDQMTLFGD